MKIRSGFVSNSSSTAFCIINNTKETKSLHSFCVENLDLIDEFNDMYADTVDIEDAIFSAVADYGNIILYPGGNDVIFGDSDGTVLGKVYDYILRQGGNSESFTWYMTDSLR